MEHLENKSNSWIRWENANLIENVRSSQTESPLRLVNIVGLCIFLLRSVAMKEKICFNYALTSYKRKPLGYDVRPLTGHPQSLNWSNRETTFAINWYWFQFLRDTIEMICLVQYLLIAWSTVCSLWRIRIFREAYQRYNCKLFKTTFNLVLLHATYKNQICQLNSATSRS